MIDLIVLSHNRLAFTEACVKNLIKNTNWQEVGGLYIFDDDSSDGTREYLQAEKYPIKPQFRFGQYGSPVRIMNEFLYKDSQNPVFAKIDSDTMVPKHWLDECLRVMHLHPGLDLLGIEAFRPVKSGAGVQREFDTAAFIGGIGLMRTRAFSVSQPTPHGRHGFTSWQERHEEISKGWLNPAIPVFLLDWIPREPWLSLTRDYVNSGWNRDWSQLFPGRCPYPESRRELWSWYCK